MDINGGNVQRLTTGHDSFGGPSWSPDGKQIAFHSAASGKNEIYLIDLQSRQVQPITNCK
jgi:TolB protein